MGSGGSCSFLNSTLSHFSLHSRKMMVRRRKMARPRGAGWRDWWARRGEGGMVGCSAGDGLGEARAVRRA